MGPNPFLGVILHAIGGLAAGSFYIPFKMVRKWSWESYWLVGGFFSWIIAPWVAAMIACPNLLAVLGSTAWSDLFWCYFFGILWGVGGLTFGLSMRYLGMSLGYAISLGFCAVFGTLIPPLFDEKFTNALKGGASLSSIFDTIGTNFTEKFTTSSGLVLLAGIGVCLLGIIFCGWAGMRKEREVGSAEKKSSIREFNFVKGVWVAVFAGIMSSCMAMAFAAGKPIAELAVAKGSPDLFKNFPILIVALAGGFTTNFLWCAQLNLRNRTGRDYVSGGARRLSVNYIFAALAGITWYFQFFFYGMGTTKMGDYDFSSWTIHMAFIIVFSSLWGIAFREWKGSSKRTHWVIGAGILILIASTIVVGYSNYITPASASSLEVDGTECEYRDSPLGVETPRPRLSWRMQSAVRGDRQSAYQILVASSPDKLRQEQADLWDSGKVDSDQSMNVEYSGLPLKSGGQCFWKVMVWDADGKASKWSAPGRWGMGMLGPDAWRGRWIKSDLELYDYQKQLKKLPDHAMEPERVMWSRKGTIRRMTSGIDEAPAVWLRKEFSAAKKPLLRALARVSGLGFYELYFNGRKIDDRHLSAAPYDYGLAVPYQVHDVTRFLRNGENAIGVILGNGYYNPIIPSALREYTADFINTPRLMFDLVLEYEDGSQERVVSDGTWRFTTDGPVRFNSLRAGETYDARKALGDWSSPGFRAESWKKALIAESPAGKLVNQDLPPVRIVKEIPAVSVAKHGRGYRFDIGVEATGWARLKVRGKPGLKITIRYPGASGHTFGRYQECQYICKGDGPETYEPRFAFNGYRFVDVIGLDYEPKASDLVGCEVVSDLRTRGRFSCSSPEFMKLHEVVRRTITNYNIQMPMDPVREKVCWTQDVQSNFETTAYNYDVGRIYAKWQEDFIRSVRPDGYVPTVVPSCFDGPTINGPWWGGMVVYNPWQLYKFYGDRRVLQRSYDSMKHYMRYLDSIAKDGIVSWGLGDWLDTANGRQSQRPELTTVAFTSTCGYLMLNEIIQKTALILQKQADAERFATKVKQVRKAIEARFYKAQEGTYDKGSQTSYILALLLDLPPKADRARVVENLKARIASDDYHISSGFIGMPFLLTFLTENGMGDQAWRIATQKTAPSWFDMVFTLNNSVLKEDWAGKLVQMPSLAVSIGAWMFRSLGGIRLDPASTGFKSFIIKPYTEKLDWVKCQYECSYGLIRCDWRKSGELLTMDISVPVNTSATVYVPGTDVMEGDLPAHNSSGVRLLRRDNGFSVFKVESGTYRFVSGSKR